MSEAEWRNGDEPHLRKIFGYLLSDHVAYQDGRDSYAPSLLFADCDYEVGDGVCGVHADAKRCGEPAIVYVRADALVNALERAKNAEAERDAANYGKEGLIGQIAELRRERDALAARRSSHKGERP